MARVAQLATLKAKDGACRESSSNFLRLKQAEFSSRSRDIIEKPTWWPAGQICDAEEAHYLGSQSKRSKDFYDLPPIMFQYPYP